MEETQLLWKFINSPRSIGSIFPSSKYVTGKMLEPINWDRAGTIIELGAGTGVFTGEIAARKKEATRLLVIERDPDMRRNLEDFYPGMDFGSRAESLSYLCRKFALPRADYIISGLPFANMEKERRNRIMTEINECLKPGGLFITFQYSLQLENTLKALFEEVTMKMEFRNLPPAVIYTCRK